MSTGHIIKAAPRTKGSAARIAATLIFTMIGIAGSVQLLRVQLISEASFVVLASIVVFFTIVVVFFDRVLKLGFKDISVEFARVEQARIEVEATREEVERIAIAIADITGFLAAFHRRLGSDSSHKLEVKWLEAKISALLKDTQISNEVREKAFRWVRAVKHMDTMKENGEKSNGEWDRIWSTVEEEIQEANKTSHATTTSRPVENVLP